MQTVVRHGVMLVGPTGGGKTSNIRTLQKAMTRIRSLPAYARVKISTLNPKAITQDQLYGYSDPYSNEWTDGTLAQIIRGQFTTQRGGTHHVTNVMGIGGG
jgi:dynein heavy chain